MITSVRRKDSKPPQRHVFDSTDAGNEAYSRLPTDCASDEQAILFPLVALLTQVDVLPEDDGRDTLERLQ